MKNMKKTKRKRHKTSDPSWDTHTYGAASTRNMFDVEWIKYYNKAEGRDQIIFLYKDKESGEIIKHRILT